MGCRNIAESLKLSSYEDSFISVKDSERQKIEHIQFIENAEKANASHIFVRRDSLTNRNTPYLYIYDKSQFKKEEQNSQDLVTIQKKAWTAGEISFCVVVYKNDEVTVIDSRKPVTFDKSKSELLPVILSTFEKADEQLRWQIFEGRLLESDNNYKKSDLPYEKLIEHLKRCLTHDNNSQFFRKFVIKLLLIKFLEEQKDENENNVIRELNPNKTNGDTEYSVCNILNSGIQGVITLFEALSIKFNGGVFDLSEDDRTSLNGLSKETLRKLSLAFRGNVESGGQLTIWDLYDFNVIPIAFISTLYEAIAVASNNERKDSGSFYTPVHLAGLLVDDLLPFDENFIEDIDFDNFKVFDPSCGSGVFLVLAYKRLVTYLKIKNKRSGKTNNIEEIQSILSRSIYGNDISQDAINITSTSLHIEFLSYLSPKEIISGITFNNLQEVSTPNLTCHDFITRYKSIKHKFDLIVGNPPFLRRDKSVNTSHDGIPENQVAYCFLKTCLSNLIKDNGSLFMVMPSSFVYGGHASKFKKDIFDKYAVQKIYDFTPLRGCLFSGATQSTIAIRIKNADYTSRFIEHVIIRNTLPNKEGMRFITDVYDIHRVLIDDAISQPYVWKINLLGGSFFKHFVYKYACFDKLGEVIKLKGLKIGGGAKASNRQRAKPVSLPFLKERNISEDLSNVTSIHLEFRSKKYELDGGADFYAPPFFCIKLNNNNTLPAIDHIEGIGSFVFTNNCVGISGSNAGIETLKNALEAFKANRNDVYAPYIYLTSSKSFIQKSSSLINTIDITNLPVLLDDEGSFKKIELTELEKICVPDINLMASSIQSNKKNLYEDTSEEQIKAYESVFCSQLNLVYKQDAYQFRAKKRVVTSGFIWVRFEYSNIDENIETINTLEKTDEIILDNILKNDLTNNGLRINRVIRHYETNPQSVSYVKPLCYKYWLKSIALRDAENYKAHLFVAHKGTRFINQ